MRLVALISIALMMAAGSQEGNAAVWDVNITAPVTGSSIVPGEEIEVKIEKLTSQNLDIISVGSTCFEESVKDFSPANQSEYIWKARIRKDLNPKGLCSIVPMGIIFSKDGKGKQGNRTLFYGMSVPLVPKRTLAITELISDPVNLEVGGCSIAQIFGREGAGPWINVTFDMGLSLTIQDETIASFRRAGLMEGKKEGQTQVNAKFAPTPASTPILFSMDVQVTNTANPNPPRCPPVSPVSTSSSIIPSPAGSTLRADGPPVAVVTEPVKPTLPLQSAPASNPQRYSGPSSGTLIWSGQPGKDGLIRIEGNQVAVGMLRGDFLPGVPIQVKLEPADVVPAQAPAESNGFKRLVLRTTKKQNMTVVIKWTVIQ